MERRRRGNVAAVSEHGDSDSTVPETFARIARLLLAEEGVERTLSKIAELTVQTIEGCEHAGMSLVQRRRIETPGASDDVARRLDAIQQEAQEGPCLDAFRDHQILQVDHLASEQRWPKFSSRAAAETGVASILSFRLFADEDTMGSLNLYSKVPAAFGEGARELGAVFAAHAAVALASARKEEQLREAMESRDIIGQAKGLLMAREGMTSEEAFVVLRKASQRLNVKLNEVAKRVVTSGEHVEKEDEPTTDALPR